MAGAVRDLFATIESFMTDKTARSRRTADASDQYTAADIEVLEGLEPVRRRPGMYVGGTDEKALHHLFA
jgi:topoisomerase-4 subunit B